jgi:hypothetical protein
VLSDKTPRTRLVELIEGTKKVLGRTKAMCRISSKSSMNDVVPLPCKVSV